ncbi:MAG: prepilin-type N-terminal cleavage/methylation domain-containing protein, partial [Desulfobacterales bacterium]
MSEKGFTLVEFLIAIVASLVVLGAIAAAFIFLERGYNQETQIVQMQENVRAGLRLMTEELSKAGYDPTGTAGAGLVVAGPDTIQFTMDLNG